MADFGTMAKTSDLAEAHGTSPLATSSLHESDSAPSSETTFAEPMPFPFAEAFASLDDAQVETEAFAALAADLEGEEFSRGGGPAPHLRRNVGQESGPLFGFSG